MRTYPMKTADVKKLEPMDRFLYFIKERERVRILKEGGAAKPWTDDEILQQYRFCNIRRMDDKVSKWLFQNWYRPYYDHENMVAACVIARHFNKPEVCEPLTWHVFGEDGYQPKAILGRIQQLKREGQTVFSGAYMIHADKSADKSEMVINRVVQPFIDNPPDIDPDSLQRSVEAINGYWNIGSFMAGQIVADLRWAKSGTWKDRHTWAPIGPGSKRGMNRLLGRELSTNLPQEEFTKHLLALIVTCKTRLPKEIHSRLEAMDYQNCCCEFDKFERTLWGEGKPKQKYPGRE
jgi:hypothetical protein